MRCNSQEGYFQGFCNGAAPNRDAVFPFAESYRRCGTVLSSNKSKIVRYGAVQVKTHRTESHRTVRKIRGEGKATVTFTYDTAQKKSDTNYK